MSEQRRPGIFLSHTWKDKSFARRLAGDLRASGARVWIDEAEIRLGDSLLEKIQEGIDSMDYLAVVLSPDSVASEWVKREVNVALNQEIAGKTVKVLPLLYRKCELPSFLIGKLYADFTNSSHYQDSLRLILDRLLLGEATSEAEVERPTLTTGNGGDLNEAGARRQLPGGDNIDLLGVEIKFTRQRGRVVRVVRNPANRVSLSIKVADGHIEESTFVFSGPGISRGDQVEILCAESFQSRGSLPMFFLNRSTGESRDLTKPAVALYRLGVIPFSLAPLIGPAVGAAFSLLVMGYLVSTANSLSDTASVILVPAPILVPSGVGLYFNARKQREVDAAKSKFEVHLLEIVSRSWN